MCTYWAPGASGPARGFGGLERAFSLRLARSSPQKKKSLSFARVFRVLPLEHGRPSSILGRPDALGVDFRGRNGLIFELFRRSRAFGLNFVPSQQNTVKTGTRSTSELSRDKTKTAKNRSAGPSDLACRATCSPMSFRTGSGASQDRPGDAFGRLLAALGSPGASQDRPWSDFWTSERRPERVPTRPRRSLDRPKPPKSDFSSISGRSGPIFHRFSIDFSAIFDRFFYDFSNDFRTNFVFARCCASCCLRLRCDFCTRLRRSWFARHTQRKNKTQSLRVCLDAFRSWPRGRCRPDRPSTARAECVDEVCRRNRLSLLAR